MDRNNRDSSTNDFQSLVYEYDDETAAAGEAPTMYNEPVLQIYAVLQVYEILDLIVPTLCTYLRIVDGES